MQSDDEDFEETLETLSPDRKIQSPGDRFPLRRTPARIESKTAQSKMEEQNLFEKLTKRSTAATSNTNAAGFAFGGMSSTSYYETAEQTSDPKNYTSKEKADRLQEIEDEKANVEREFPNELFDFCGAEANVEEVRLIDIPYNKGKRRKKFSIASKLTSSGKQERKFTQASREEKKLS